MLRLDIGDCADRELRVLCLGAHSDDIEIGCGGTLIALQNHARKVTVKWVVFSARGEREKEARHSASVMMADVASLDTRVMDFEDGYFPDQWADVKRVFEGLKDWGPDLIFTHREVDRHQDHRVISELTWNTFRDHLILEYEIPKWDGDFGNPNVYSPLSAETCQKKARHLLEHFLSQTTKPWFDAELFTGLARIRGMECRAEDGYAEAFFGRKLLLSFT